MWGSLKKIRLESFGHIWTNANMSAVHDLIEVDIIMYSIVWIRLVHVQFLIVSDSTIQAPLANIGCGRGGVLSQDVKGPLSQALQNSDIPT